MAAITYDGQTFLRDGRRTWILGAAMQYARIPVEAWADRIRAARQAGFNTIATSCPWLLHEPRKGRFDFTGQADVRRFLELCEETGMQVVLRPGPYIGDGFEGGGLPGWLEEIEDLRLREPNGPFLARVSSFFRKLLNEISDLMANKDGPIALVQVEHAWTCTNDEEGEHYLGEISRILRENGVGVPLINTNDLWQEPVGTIDTWRGSEDLLANLRQLRSLQPKAPRLVGAFSTATPLTWGCDGTDEHSASDVLRGLGEILAAGAGFIVDPFHAGTNFEYLAGRTAGLPDGFVGTKPATGAPLGEAGARGAKYSAVKRIVTFAGHFSHVFGELDPEYHPIVRDLDDSLTGGGRAMSIVPLRGGQGRVVFIFSGQTTKATTMVLDHGIRMPVQLTGQPVTWCVIDVDLRGAGRLDYVNICPWAILDRSVVVLFGPARAPVYLSLSGNPLEAVVPGGQKPLVVEHHGVTFVICNHEQIDASYHDDTTVYVGVDGLDEMGQPIAHSEFKRAFVIRSGEGMKAVTLAPPTQSRGVSKKITPRGWKAASAADRADGSSARYATLKGPATLGACGATNGYGWYRIELQSNSARKRLVHLPRASDRVHVFVDGELQRVWGAGPGASREPFELKLPRGRTMLTAMVDHLGRFAEGNEMHRRIGLFGHMFEIKPLRVTAKVEIAEAVDPFEVRSFISGRAKGQSSDLEQVIWRFQHLRKTRLLVDVPNAAVTGTWVLNDRVIDYFPGVTGSLGARLMLDPAHEAFKRGKNELRFAPDPGQKNPAKAMLAAATVYECVEALTEGGTWGFCKWECPPAASFEVADAKATRGLKGTPCWWKGVFDWPADNPRPVWLEVLGLSKGQAWVNGQNLGRYFTQTATGGAVGPQTRLLMPRAWLRDEEPNQIVLFDEHGFSASKVRVVLSHKGELD